MNDPKPPASQTWALAEWEARHPCPECGGSGEVESDNPDDGTICDFCDGSGVEPIEDGGG